MTMRFGDFIALDNVELKVRPGTFHALLGENGAGKSTLVKCIMGYYHADRRRRPGRRPRAGDRQSQATRTRSGSAWSTSISRWCRRMTVAENLVLARDDVPAVVDWAKEKQELEAFLARMPFQVPLDAPGLRHLRRRAAEVRDPQAALSEAPLPDPRRADLGADAGRGRRGAGHAARHGRARAS